VHNAGDHLLYSLSAWDETPWSRYLRAFDELFSLAATDHSGQTAGLALERRRALLVLAALGHLERGPNGSIVAAPATLAELPAPGSVRAVLCGRRSPTAVAEIRDAARSLSTEIRVRESSQAARSRYAPSRVEVVAPSADLLASLAGSLGIIFSGVPVAWTLSELAGTLDTYIADLEWRPEPELDWERNDFCVDDVRMKPAGRASSGSLRLSRYTNPVTSEAVVRLWRAGEAADVDLSWGRFALLKEAGRRVVEYEPRSFVLAEPWGAPLPPLLARALTLCSGEAASEVPPPEKVGSQGSYQYAGVPPDVADIVLAKTGQADV
jgi:hypothetical protein